MLIRELEIEDFKKFVGTHRVIGFEPGLNLICGPNEMGKSTILAALKAVLFERHRSKAETIKSFQSDGHDLAPVLKLTFETVEGQWTIEKRFLKNPYARLTRPDGRQIDGDEAEEALEKALGFDRPGNRGASSESLGIWGALWVEQGQSFALPPLSEPARTAIHGCLEAEVGMVAGGRRGQTLIQAIEKALNDLLDKRGRPRGRMKELQESKLAKDGEVLDLASRLNQLESHLDKLPGLIAEHRRLSEPRPEQEMEKALQEARREQQALIELLEEMSGAERVLGQAELARDRARTRIDEREALLCSEAEAGKAVGEAEKALEGVAAQHEQLSTALDRLQAAAAQARENLRKAEEVYRLAERRRDASRSAADLTRLRNQLDQAKTAAARRDDALNKLARLRVDKAALDAIEKAEQRLLVASGRVNAAATHVAFDVAEAAAQRISLGAERLGERREACILRQTAIAVDDVGKIIITPSVSDAARIEGEAGEADRELKRNLEAVGAQDVDEARSLYERRRAAEQEVREAEAEIRIHAPGDAAYGIDPGIDGLERQVTTMQAVHSAATAELGDLPSLGQAEEDLRAARASVDSARLELDQAEAALAPAQTRAHEVTRQHTIAQRTLADAQKRHRELLASIAAARGERSDDDLARGLAEAEETLASAKAGLEALKARRGPETAEQLSARIQRLERSLQGRRDQRAAVETEIREHRAAITAVEGDGIAEKLQSARADAELLEREAAALQREADVLSLLAEVLTEAERRAQEQFFAPVTRRIEPYLSLLFDGAKVELDSELRIAGICRNGGLAEAYDKLSDGTREQIAVLARIGFAELMAEQGRPVAIVLDDALVFSDDDRIEVMFDILNMAAKRLQIVVLTCRKQLFAGLGANVPALSLAGSGSGERALALSA